MPRKARSGTAESVNAEIREALRRSGLRSTPQRHVLLAYLFRGAGHLTADQIFAGVNRSDPRTSRATVYNNLHALVRAGVLQAVTLDSGAVRYDINRHWHHHFICDRCGRLEDIAASDVLRPLRRPRLGSRIVRNYQIVFRGTCERCSKRSS